jgi:hypothetical protein
VSVFSLLDEAPPNYDDDYGEGPPPPSSPVYNRPSYGNNRHNDKRQNGRGKRQKFGEDPDGDPGYGGYQGRGNSAN